NIQEAAIYNVALSSTQVSTHYTKGTDGLGNYQTTITGDSPIRYYRLGESAAGNRTIVDSGSQLQNGTLQSSGVAFGQLSLVGGEDAAVVFPGNSQSYNNYISIPTTSLPTGNAAISLEAWINGYESDANTGIISVGTLTATQVHYVVKDGSQI